MTAFEHTPADLQERDQWVLWRWEERDGKPTKAPYRAREPFVRASSTDRRSWASYKLALSAAGYADGLGYVFSGDDPFCGVDLEVELPEADRAAITRTLNSYTEQSVSGGCHVIVRASLNGGGRHPPGIGVFDRERFFVVTGLHIAGTPLAVEPRQAELDAVIAEYLPRPVITQEMTATQPVALDDQELLERMMASKAGDKIRRLWQGDWSDYPSQSEADFALLTHLAFWTRRDPERMRSLFEGSGLRRAEGRDRPKSIGYLARTVEKAVAVTGDVWGSDPTPADGGTGSGSDSGFRSLVIAPAGIENQVVSGGSGGQSPPAVPPESPLPFQRLAVMVENAPAEPEWTWRGYLALFVLALLAGRPKVGKSTLVMALVAAAVRGELFLGLEAKARGVLLLTEERRDTLAEKARILGLMDEEAPVYVLARGDVRDTPWPEVVRQAMTFCREHDLDVLIVDTLDRWTGLRGDLENAAGAVNEAMEPLQFAAAAGLAVVAVSHQRKSRGEYGEAVRGSNAFTGAVDVVIELERPSRTMQLGGHARVLRAVSRFSSTPEELFFELGDDGFLPISDVAQKKADVERSEVLGALEAHDSPVSVDDLFEEVDVGKRALRRYLAELRERGLAVRTGGGVKGDPYLWEAVDEREEP